MISWFISDLHLKDVNERNGNTLLRFLFLLNKNPKNNRLFMLGDIFDFWLSNGRAFRHHYKVLINEIEKFKKAGGEVHYFEGNHDFHVDVFWTKYLDIPVYEQEAFFEIDGLKVRLEHGDFINPDDVAYLKYRALVRHPVIEPIGHVVPGWFWKWLGEKESQKSRKKSGGYMLQNAEKVRKLIHTHVEKVYDEKPYDLIVTGHMHIFDDYKFVRDAKTIRSVNLGTWLDQPRALKIENGKLEVVNVHEIVTN